jgi:hypothetical protein
MGVPRSVTRALAGVLAAPVVLVAACGGGDTSIADPPISPHPTTSSPTQQPHRESPEHFIRRWAAEDTRIQVTGSTNDFRRMSKGCGGCTKLADLVDRIYDNGGYIHTKGWQVHRITESAPYLFDLFVFSRSTAYTESGSGPVHHLPSGPAHFQLKLTRQAGAWNVSSLVQVATS